MSMSALGMPLDLLPPQKCAKAIAIMDDFKKKSFNLRQLIATKKHELESLSFDQKTSLDTLPRLGYELQVLRDELRAATEAWAVKLAGQGRLGNWLTKQAVNHVEELRGKRAAMDSVFHMHHFAHAQNDLVSGSSIGGMSGKAAAAANKKAAGE